MNLNYYVASVYLVILTTNLNSAV